MDLSVLRLVILQICLQDRSVGLYLRLSNLPVGPISGDMSPAIKSACGTDQWGQISTSQICLRDWSVGTYLRLSNLPAGPISGANHKKFLFAVTQPTQKNCPYPKNFIGLSEKDIFISCSQIQFSHFFSIFLKKCPIILRMVSSK